MELCFVPLISLVGLYPKNPKMTVQKTICTPVFTAVLLTIAKSWKQLKCPSVDEWIKKYGTFTPWNNTQQKKKGIPTFCYSMDGTGDYYAK